MYSEMINNLSYVMSFNFAEPFNLMCDYTELLSPMFLAVLGVRLGVAIFRYLIK